MGDRSQRLVLEQLQEGAGVGVIISPRDLPFQNAVAYAAQYRALEVDLILDLQYYVPDFTNDRLDTYPPESHRAAVSQLRRISDAALTALTGEVTSVTSDLNCTAVLAPALLYEPGRPDVSELNARLFMAARHAADALDLPCYATVFVSHACAASDRTILAALSDATALDADGWYFGYEFPAERIPSSRQEALRCAAAGLALACTGKPVLHSYAGPMAVVSPCFGATAAGIGHFQNTWRFNPGRWQVASGQGGGGDAPPRFFSTSLWGTIVYPDEIVQLPQALKTRVLTLTPFSQLLASPQPVVWSRWEANKHLIFSQATALSSIFAHNDPGAAFPLSSAILQEAVALHAAIAQTGLALRDSTNSYQANWLAALSDLASQHGNDFEYLSMVA